MELGLASHLNGCINWNQQEKDIFMAINICRARPAQFSMIVHNVHESVPLAKKLKAHPLIQKMKKMQRLPPVEADGLAYQACTRNN